MHMKNFNAWEVSDYIGTSKIIYHDSPTTSPLDTQVSDRPTPESMPAEVALAAINLEIQQENDVQHEIGCRVVGSAGRMAIDANIAAAVWILPGVGVPHRHLTDKLVLASTYS